MSNKPVIFISHSSKDKEIALALQSQIAIVFDIPTNNVFRSTDPYAIPSGSEWFERINHYLDLADALVAIVSKHSIESIWVGYELGYFWHKTGGKDNIHPLVTPETQLRGPIERLQYKSLENPESLSAFFDNLCVNLKLGDPKKADVSAIVSTIQPYEDEMSEWLINKRLEEFLMNHLEAFKQHRKLQESTPFPLPKLQNNIFMGWTVSYDELDKKYNFPKGTSKNFLSELASRYGLEPIEENEAGIKFNNNRKR